MELWLLDGVIGRVIGRVVGGGWLVDAFFWCMTRWRFCLFFF